MDRVELLQSIKGIVLPVLERLGYDLVEVNFVISHGRRTLRVFIDKPGGVTVEDCAAASRGIESALDERDVVPGRYYLEVSSPGAERPLKTRDDFVRFSGRKAFLRLRRTYEGISEVRGKIGVVGENKIEIETEDGQMISIPFEEILKANLSL